MMNYQHYNKEEFFKKFLESDVYSKVKTEYNHIISDQADIGRELELPEWTPRVTLNSNSIFLYSVFYYIDFLLEQKPSCIADVGCGVNLLKKYLPNIIGFDKTSDADYKEHFNEDFISQHYEEFDAAIAMNSIHFRSLSEFSQLVNDFGKIIKPGGRGFITINLDMMIRETRPHEWALMFKLDHELTVNDYSEYIENELKKIKYKIIVYDFLADDSLSDMYNGNIRLVFEK